jgi:hypothetical protein
MEQDEVTNKLTAWWLGIAPSRQEELLMEPQPPLPWLEDSIVGAGLEPVDVQRFLDAKRSDPEFTQDAGLNPRP